LFLGACCALVADSLDDKIQTVEEIERELELVPLGILPYLGEPGWYGSYRKGTPPRGRDQPYGIDSLAIFADPHSPYTEALRALRTSLLLSKSSTPPQVLLVTSSVEGEGKSILSANFAALLAQGGKRVLLVDADLHKPSLGEKMGLKSATGLSEFLTNAHSQEVYVEVPRLPKLHVLLSGKTAPFPADLFGHPSMREVIGRWRESYDFIVFDSPPVLSVTDAVVLASLADATLLVARYGMTNRLSLARSHRIIAQSAPNRIGVVLNGVSQGSSFHYEYYGHSKSVGYPAIAKRGQING
jgi:succinoglycan biosynthesis transport protein ExoP